VEGIGNPDTDKYKKLTNNWNYDASCTVTSLPVWDFENFKRLNFVVQSLHETSSGLEPRTEFGVVAFVSIISSSK
jgi:hypothetical protein